MEYMQYIAPLLQTLLWVGLIAAIVFRFHRPIDALLTALHKRVEGGSTIKAGPFELSDQFKPQDPMQQKQKAETEMQEMLQIEQQNVPVVGQPPPPEVKSRFFAAEDLALRAIQAEFQQPLKRQVTAGPDMDFDGVFTADRQLHIVEVKYVVREKNVQTTIRRTLESFARFLQRTRWHNVKVLVAIVVEYPVDLAALKSRLEEMAGASSIPVVFRCYSMSELREQFGIPNSNG